MWHTQLFRTEKWIAASSVRLLPPLDAIQISEVSEIIKFRKKQSTVYMNWADVLLAQSIQEENFEITFFKSLGKREILKYLRKTISIIHFLVQKNSN